MTEKGKTKTAAKAKTKKTATPQEEKPKNKGGRPSTYTQAIAEKICDLIATSDKGLEQICRENDDIPHRDTVRLWTWKNPEFHAMYMRAKAMQQLWMAERALQVAADGSNDVYVDDEGKVRVDHDVIQRSRLLVDTIKWQATKLAPKLFGDKIDLNHGGQEGNPIRALYEQLSGTPLKPKSSE